jgi:HSP20 family protein
MANVGKKDGGEQKAQQQPQGEKPQRAELMRRETGQGMTREPFQMMWRDPFRLMRDMLVDPWRVFSQGMAGGLARNQNLAPSFDIRETDDAFIFKADMPGLKPENLEITLDNNDLLISGSREEEREEGEGRYHTVERSFGSFSRMFTLPDTADTNNIKSDLKDGELTLVVPKKAGAAQKRKIQVGSGSKS